MVKLLPSNTNTTSSSRHGRRYTLVVGVGATLCLSALSVFSFSREIPLFGFQQEMDHQGITTANTARELQQEKPTDDALARTEAMPNEDSDSANEAATDAATDAATEVDEEEPSNSNPTKTRTAAVPTASSEAATASSQEVQSEPTAGTHEAIQSDPNTPTTTTKTMQTATTSVPMQNLHENFPMTCGQEPDRSGGALHPAIEPLTDLYWNDLPPTPGYKKYMYIEGKNAHGLQGGLDGVLKTQVCLYHVLHRWRELAQRLGITRWAVHGGSAISAQCYGAINPWDDDIDMTVTNCSALDELYDQGQDPLQKYPDIPPNHISLTHTPYWIPRLIDNDNLILIKGHNSTAWYKLMTVQQAYLPSKSIMGMDIECMDRAVSKREQQPKRQAGWTQYLQNKDQPLDDVMYGPTKIQMLPAKIHQSYVQIRYRKESPCRYPFHHGLTPEPYNFHNDNPTPTHNTNDGGDQEVYLPDIQAASIDTAIAKWYVPKTQRNAWLDKVGDGKQQEYTSQIPNLDDVEIDNTISPDGCKNWGSNNNNTLKVIGWNAQRGKHWDKFASLIETLDELKDPYVLLLNEMDIGMARTGNIHTARRLALKMKMNYAYSVEFLELTRGSKQEQNLTEGMRNALGLHGNAILTKCIIGDTMVLRDPLPNVYFSKSPSWINGGGYEKRLGGRVGIFARIYQEMPTNMNLYYNNSSTGKDDVKASRVRPAEQDAHFVVGNVHKLDQKSIRNRKALWEYFEFGAPPSDLYEGRGQNPGNQLGVVIQGDFFPEVCELSGLSRMETPGVKLNTFPVKSCEPGKVRVGPSVSDHFCSNMESKSDVIVTPPCWYGSGGDEAALTIADHAIVSVELQAKEMRTSTR